MRNPEFSVFTFRIMMIVLCAVASLAPYSLRWAPTVGDRSKYQVDMEIVKDGVKTEIETISDHTVVNVDKDQSYTLRSTTRGTLFRSGGQETRDDRDSTIEIVFGPDGRPIRFLTPSPTGVAMRVASLNRFVAPESPISVGDSYVIKRTGGDTSMRSNETTFTLSKVDPDSGVATVDVDYHETSGADQARATGTWKISTSTNQWISLDLAIQGFKTGLGEVVSYHMRRI